MVKQPETRYAQSPQGNIAYQVVGDGPMDLVVVPGVPGEWKLFAPVGEHDPLENLQAPDQHPVQDPWADRLKGQARIGRMLLRMARRG